MADMVTLDVSIMATTVDLAGSSTFVSVSFQWTSCDQSTSGTGQMLPQTLRLGAAGRRVRVVCDEEHHQPGGALEQISKEPLHIIRPSSSNSELFTRRRGPPQMAFRVGSSTQEHASLRSVCTSASSC